jgi:hypothetical protein
MKKLLAIVLTAVLVLAFAAITMAEVKVTGEANFFLNVAAPELADLGPPATHGQKGAGSDCKVVFDAAVNDAVSVNAAIKSSYTAGIGWDTYSMTDKIGSGTLKVGFWGANFNGSTDILAKFQPELKAPAAIQYTIPFGDALAARIMYMYQYDIDNNAAAYQVGVTYTSDAFVVEVGQQSSPDALGDAVSGTALNFTYNLGDALKVYLNYETYGDGDNAKDEIVGVSYAPADGPFLARFEYNIQKRIPTVTGDEYTPMGLYLGTKVNGVTYKLGYTKDDARTDVPTTYLKATVGF